jgi:hypothetical protein
MPSSQSWQDSLNPHLVNRLARPLMQPGFIDLSLGYRVIGRSHRFNQLLPLLDYVGRHQPSNSPISSAPPIVYATSVIPISSTIESGQTDSPNAVTSYGERTSKSLPVVQPIQSPASTVGDILIQRKMVSQPEARESAQRVVVPKTIQANETQKFSSNFQASPQLSIFEKHPFRASLALENPLHSLKHDISPNTSSQSEFQRKINPPEGLVESLPAVINGLLVVQGRGTQAKSTFGTDTYVAEGRSQRQYLSTVQDVDLAKSAQKPLIQNPTKSKVPKAAPFTLAPPISTTEGTNLPRQQIPAAPMEPTKRNVELTTLVTAPGNSTIAAQVAETLTRQNRDSPVQNQSVPRVTASIVPKPLTTFSVQSDIASVSTQTVNAVDIDQIADKVERKLMRRLVIERERRGQKR